VDSLHIAYPNFSMVPEETNVFRFLAESVVSVSVPYTSTSYVAASLNKHAIYYDPFGELVPVFEADLHVHFAADRESLLNLIEQAIG
jgi:polysaccharide biosynthesis PFTS motif protein